MTRSKRPANRCNMPRTSFPWVVAKTKSRRRTEKLSSSTSKEGLDRRGVVGGVEHDRRPPPDHFHPRRPADLGQPPADRRLRDRPAGPAEFFHGGQRNRRVGGLMAAQQGEHKAATGGRAIGRATAGRGFMKSKRAGDAVCSKWRGG